VHNEWRGIDMMFVGVNISANSPAIIFAEQNYGIG
jgi:hypothetical protein